MTRLFNPNYLLSIDDDIASQYFHEIRFKKVLKNGTYLYEKTRIEILLNTKCTYDFFNKRRIN